ncbi:GntR family transcriptional regulator [Krasilnikovia sp. MM14-A1004]|uniref:GntR family transcriptional regulator n=1 Tax=Krasilnikovia sp. MM14-A1004 TaxID=3373541 RepID=UPI00399CDC7F
MSEEEFKLPPSYREIAEIITAEIDKGTYPYGSRLPSTAELAHEFDVSVATVERAMRLLAQAGTIVGGQGLGRFVTRRPA